MHLFLFCLFVKFAFVNCCLERRVSIQICDGNLVLKESQLAVVPGGGLVKILGQVGIVLCKAAPCRVISLTGGKYKSIATIG